MRISKLRRTIMILSVAMSVPTVSASSSGEEIVPQKNIALLRYNVQMLSKNWRPGKMTTWQNDTYCDCTYLFEKLDESQKKSCIQNSELYVQLSTSPVLASRTRKSGEEIVLLKGNIYADCTSLYEKLNEIERGLHTQGSRIDLLTSQIASLADNVLKKTEKNIELACKGQCIQITVITRLNCITPALKEFGSEEFAKELENWNNLDSKKKSRLDELYEESEKKYKKTMKANEGYREKVENKAKEKPDIFHQMLSTETEIVNKLEIENKSLEFKIKYGQKNDKNNLGLVKSLPELEACLSLANKEGQERLREQKEEIKFLERCIMESKSKLLTEKKRQEGLLRINCNLQGELEKAKALTHTKEISSQKVEKIEKKMQKIMEEQVNVYNGIEISKECVDMLVKRIQAVNENRRLKKELDSFKKEKKKVDEFFWNDVD